MISTRYTGLAALALCLLASVGCRRDGNGDGDPRIADPAFPYPDYDPPTNPDDDFPGGHNDDPFESVCEPEPSPHASLPDSVDSDEGGADTGEPAFSVTATAASVVVPQGGSVDLAVMVERATAEEIDVTIDGLPAGVTATTLRLVEGETTGVLTLTAEESVAYRSPDHARVRARTALASHSVPLDIQVRGEGGRADRSFGVRGNAGGVLPLLTVNDVVEQPDGRLLATGWDEGGDELGATALVVCRLEASGWLDATFGAGGCARAELGVLDEGGRLHLQADGRILAATAFGDLRVARFTPSGALDDTFGEAGVVRLLDMPGGNLDLLGVGGKILVTRGGVVARLHRDGSIDNSFGTYGRVAADPALELLARGECGFVVAGRDRLTAIDWDGNIDLSFGSTGRAALPFEARAAARGAGSAGYVVAGAGARLAQLGDGGAVLAEYAAFETMEVTSVAVAADGRTIAGGMKYADEFYLAMARRNADGTPDEEFCACTLPYGETRGIRALRDGRYLILGRNGETTAGHVIRVWD